MRLDAMEAYLKSDTFLPHFILVGDKEYAETKNALIEQQFHVISLNNFCGGDDKLPNIDTLFDRLCNSEYSKIVVFGLGEYLALRGKDEGYRVLSKLKDLSLTKPPKVVILLRGVSAIMKKIEEGDKIRFDETSRLTCIGDNPTSSLSIILTSLPLGDSLLNGCKALLTCMETEERTIFMANTKIDFPNTTIHVRSIKRAYEGIQYLVTDFRLPETLGTDKQWLFLLIELAQHNRSLNEVFKHYNLINDLEKNWKLCINNPNDQAWLYFIALQFNIKQLSNKYLALVLEKTNRIEDLENNILKSIIDISYTDKQFLDFYRDRKILIEKISETKMLDFIVSNSKLPNESIYRLTDTTLAERKEIIRLIVKNEMIQFPPFVYPSLTHYMKPYTFTNCNTLSQRLTDYFCNYKKQKLLNKLDDKFMNNISEMATTLNRCYNQLPTRNQIIDDMNKKDSYLYWLDALGVEYIAYIQEGCERRELALKVNIGRANLPTITTLNRDFFLDWTGDKNLPNGDKRLDEIKHKESEYNFTNEPLPLHLAEELRIIDTVLDSACECLKKGKYLRYILTSDHGASRLAVLKQQEEMYETDTKGEHSGRCCKFFEGCDLPAATHENDYLVLADYGRFKGSRSANVEVHGGATLEEVLVPIFEITMKDTTVSVELITPIVKISHRKIAEITLFSKSLVIDLSVCIDGKSYTPIKTDEYHYTISLPDIKRQGIYPIEVYDRAGLVKKLEMTVENESAIKNDRFENLF